MNTSIPFKISNGRLDGPSGSWDLQKISAVFMRHGGKLGWKKFLIFYGSVVAATSLVAAPIAVPLGVIGVSAAYAAHQTIRVFIVIEGVELEIHYEVFFLKPWKQTLGEYQEWVNCNTLVSLIKSAICP